MLVVTIPIESVEACLLFKESIVIEVVQNGARNSAYMNESFVDSQRLHIIVEIAD